MTEVAGRLSERVRFEARAGVRGPAGEAVDRWALVATRWAQVEPEGRSLSDRSADGLRPARRWLVRIRPGPVLVPGMRVIWRGLTLTLTGVAVDPADGALLMLRAEDAGG